VTGAGRALAVLGLSVLSVLPAWAQAEGPEEIVAGLSQNRVQITANFDGSAILIYGAVKRDAPDPGTPPLAVVVTVEGPSAPLTIRKKDHVAGIWLNRDSVTIDAAPSFYVVATSAPLAASLSETDDLRFQVTLQHLIHAIGITGEAANSEDFVAALERIRANQGRYRVEENTVQLVEDTLFRADVTLPPDLVEGNYQVRMFITRGGHVVDMKESTIFVRKAGLERFLFNLAQDQPFLYGLISLAIAVIAGWAASEAFRYLRNR
jgi:uncharacterized protein (TIGR02186 family)